MGHSGARLVELVGVNGWLDWCAFLLYALSLSKDTLLVNTTFNLFQLTEKTLYHHIKQS